MKALTKIAVVLLLVLSTTSFADVIAVQSYTVNHAADPWSPDTGGIELTDGIKPSNDVYGGGWSLYDATSNIEIIFTLTNSSVVGSIELYYQVYTPWGFGAPDSITYSFSTDGVTFTNPVTKDSGFVTTDGVATAQVSIPKTTCNYIKAVIHKSSGTVQLGEFTFNTPSVNPISYVANLTPEAAAPDTSGEELADGVLPTGWSDDGWVGYFTESPNYNLVITFDMSIPHELSTIGLHYMVYSDWNIQCPSSVTFTFSNDGINFGNPVTSSAFDNSNGIRTAYIDVLGSVARYVRATITAGAGSNGYIRLGEVKFVDKGQIVYTAVPAANYTAPDAGGELIDGLTPDYIYDPGWSDYSVPDSNLVITFNLNNSINLSCINLSYLVQDAWVVYAPASVTYSFSNDGVNFSNPVTITGFNNSDGAHTEAANFPGGITAKYVKAELKPNGAWLRLSEIKFVEYGEISYTASVGPQWLTPDNNNNLSNGIVPTGDYDSDWLVYDAATEEITLNLNSVRTLSDVAIRYHVLAMWSRPSPNNVVLTFSTDGINFANPVTYSTFDETDGAHTAKISVPNVTCQYVKAVFTAPSDRPTRCLGEFTFYGSGTGYNMVPAAAAAGLETFDNPNDILVVFDHPVNAASAANVGNYKMTGNIIKSAEVWSKASNCVKVSVAIPLVTGVSHNLQYKNIEGLAGDKFTYWRQTNYFAQTSITAAASKILQKQLADGGYNVYSPSNGVSFQSGDNNIWIRPDYGNLAAQAMLMANEVSPNASYLASVNSYLHWYVNHLETDGTIYDYTGTYPGYTKSSDRLSTDAYAAQFIETAFMYYQATHDTAFLNWVWPYVIQVAGAMDLTLQSDGLTYAKPSTPVKALMNNTDVYVGYKAAAKFAALKSDTVRQSAWSTKANNCLAGMETMYLGDSLGRYAVAIAAGSPVTDWAEVYPDGDSQMYAIRNVLMETNINRASKVWNASIQQFVQNHVPNENISSAWWVLGGFGAGQGDEAETEACFIAVQKEMAAWANYIFTDYQSIMIMHNRAMQQKIGDFNIDGRVDFEDFAIFAAKWSQDVELGDLADFADKWLAIEIWWN
jgi:hypothetical protein